MEASYLLDLIILLIAAAILVPLSHGLKMGAVPGFLFAGIVVGPFGLGVIRQVAEIGHIAEMGVVLLLFVIGMEMNPHQLWRMRRLVFGLGSLQVILVGLVIGVMAHFLFAQAINQAFFIGLVLALSSTAFVLQILAEQKLLLTKYGRVSFSILLFQDLAVVPLFALIPLIALPSLSLGQNIGYVILESIGIILIVILGGRYVLHPLLHRAALSGNTDVFTGSALLIVLASAAATEYAGMSMAMGAFMAGLLISDSVYRHQILAEILPFRGLLLGIFFMFMGMSLNLSLFAEKPFTLLGLVLLLMLTKVLILTPIVARFGLRKRTALAVALVLAQSGEFGLVLFSLAFESGILSEQVYQQLLLIILLSLLATPLLSKIADSIRHKQAPVLVTGVEIEEPEESSPIVIAGFGRVGQHIGDILGELELNYVALELDASIVAEKRKQGYPVYYGDVKKHQVMKNAGADNAKALIVTINDLEITENVVSELRRMYPSVPLYARAHSMQQCRKLKALGAEVISETIETSVELGRRLLVACNADPELSAQVLKKIKSSYYSEIAD